MTTPDQPIRLANMSGEMWITVSGVAALLDAITDGHTSIEQVREVLSEYQPEPLSNDQRLVRLGRRAPGESVDEFLTGRTD